jgi:hypothetical protein
LPILDHGGPVIGIPNVYLIWYGNWNQNNGTDTPDGQQIIRDFLKGLSGSPYYQTNASYPGVTGTFIVPSNMSEFTDTSKNNKLSDASVQAVVTNAITTGALPADRNGIYFVLSSSDVTESSGFCSNYCGWHTRGTISGLDIKYAFVGNASHCLSACAAQSIGPNGNAGVDGMVSVIAHELEETNTDPDLNAWYDKKGAEDADKCAWTFGSNQSKDSKGAYYNMTLPSGASGSRNYLIQRELGKDNKCYVDYPHNIQ